MKKKGTSLNETKRATAFRPHLPNFGTVCRQMKHGINSQTTIYHARPETTGIPETFFLDIGILRKTRQPAKGWITDR
jgi:hypothetical protein